MVSDARQFFSVSCSGMPRKGRAVTSGGLVSR